MKLYTVWDNHSVSVNEKCLIDIRGDYIGVDTGRKYFQYDHHHSNQTSAVIIGVDSENKTGMYHLDKAFGSYDEDNRHTWKDKFVGCTVTLETAHWAGEHRIYRCLELNEYFSDSEVKLI